MRTRSVPAMAVGTIGTPYWSASLPMPGLASPSSPLRERPPSTYITISPPRLRIASAVLNASSSRWPRRTGNTPPCV